MNNWENEFDEKFHMSFDREGSAYTGRRNKLKTFIENLLTEQRQELKRKIEGMKKETSPGTGLNVGYNAAIKDVLDTLNSYEYDQRTI